MQNQNLTITNCRDMGGIKTQDGHTIKYGKLFRTSYIKIRTPEDKEFIESIKLDRVIDFRSTCEVAEKPDTLPSYVKYYNVPVYTEEEGRLLGLTQKMVVKLLFSSKKRVQQVRQAMYDSYGVMAYRISSYKPLFDGLTNGETIAFHCTAGKDRTGIGALLIMLALGCDLKTCEYEYLLSNEYQKKPIEDLLNNLKKLPVRKYIKDFCVEMSSVYKNLFDNAVNSIFSKYDSIEDFLLDVYGITKDTIDIWKNNYLD